MNSKRKSEERHPLWTLLDGISSEHAKQGARITELRAKIAAMTLAPGTRHRCGICGSTWKSERGLAEHVYYSHRGPLPQHIITAESAAADSEPHTPAGSQPGPGHVVIDSVEASSTHEATVSPSTPASSQTTSSTTPARHAP